MDRAGGPWFTTAAPPQTQLRKSAKSRPTDRPMVRRPDHGPWSVSVDLGPLYPSSDVNDDRPAQTVLRSTVLEVKEKQDSDPIFLKLNGAIHQQRVEVFSQGGDGVLRYQGRLCVHDVGELRQNILAEAYNSRYSIHPGATKMYRDLREVYWWNGMKRDIADFMAKCPNCQHVKIEHQKPGGMTHEIDISTWKWEVINMDFITGLPRTRRQHDSIWVIVDRVTMSSRFLVVKTTDSKSFQKDLGTQVNLITTFHPQTDGQAERTIHTLEEMLRACVIDFKGISDDHLPLIEFAYNNSYHSSNQMAPYKTLYGCRCRSPVGWFEVGETALIGPDSVHDAMKKVQLIRDRLKTAQSRQKYYTYVRRRELEFQLDEWVFLKGSPIKGVLRFGKKGKLSPRYVGPYNISKRIGKTAYELEFSGELAAVHPVFHISLLKKCVGDPAFIVPLKSVAVKDSLSKSDKSRPMDRPTSVGQTTVRGLYSWMLVPFTKTLMRMMTDQHRPSFDPWSVGVIIGEGQQPVRGELLIGSTSNGHHSQHKRNYVFHNL
ncbi:hypothetical protein MTR67_026185 [Solanum verrucosum]|uniref:Integrase catalytic domain-containing protein n=1 Tax=Solanum verrucosum TaxID=315347 RepID=A0AAF0TZ38_SOLVR|nr:hypothetical protein MTR67_026185 [Solanum verrucosum]